MGFLSKLFGRKKDEEKKEPLKIAEVEIDEILEKNEEISEEVKEKKETVQESVEKKVEKVEAKKEIEDDIFRLIAGCYLIYFLHYFMELP